MSIVPNIFPKQTHPTHRVAFVGEAPGRDEEILGQPFVGVSGRFLKTFIAKGLGSDYCFFGNISQHRPPNNEIENFQWDGIEIQSGLTQLKQDLAQFKPNIVILLGKTALYAALNRSDISNYRGSLFVCSNIDSPFFGYKCIATYHPSVCLKMYEYVPIFAFDIARGLSEGHTSLLQLPERDIKTCRTVSDVTNALSRIRNSATKCGTDIEGYVFDMTCIGIADSPHSAFVIPFTDRNGFPFWSIDESIVVWKALTSYLEDPNCPKVWQNGLYDRFVIQHSYGIICRGNTDDTMLQWHERYCELPKGLDTQTSILTREPYYKHERKSDSWETKMTYCGKDACVTLEIHLKLNEKIDSLSRTHYMFNRDLLNPLLYMELRGISYATEKAKERRAKILSDLYVQQYELDTLSNHGHKLTSIQDATAAIRDLMCYKRGTPLDITQLHKYVKKEYAEDIKRAIMLASKLPELTPSEHGELSTLLKRQLNVESPKFSKYLYDKLGLPIQINKKTKQPTADYYALLKLQKKTDSKVIPLAIGLRDKATHSSMLSIHADSDERIRCGYNAVGTNTGRLTCYASPTGSGYNLQTIPKKDRDLFLADSGHHFFQCDLSGADGWTVGAHCKNLGDSTMLDDFYACLKPARILTLMLRKGAAASSWSREKLYDESKAVGGDDPDYFMCKCLIWGMCYLLGVDTAIDLVFKESEGKLLMSRKEMEDFRRLVFMRYWGVTQWHEFTKRRLARSPVITAASGLTRRFFGRRDEILGEALSFEPQAVTTYATNMAALNLWNDAENRLDSTKDNDDSISIRLGRTKLGKLHSLRVEPLHQVHDALCGQFAVEDTSWATSKIKQWFNNEIIIANQKIVIPFTGEYGPSWGELGPKYNGGEIK